MSQKTRLREHFDKQHDKRVKRLFISESKNLYQIHWSLPSQLSWKTSLLLTCKIFWLILNTLAADEKFPVLNRNTLTIPIQMQLSQKQKSFSQFFAVFWKFRLKFNKFETKYNPHRFCNFEITDFENVVR